jgi:hypothetical protein
MKVTMWNKFSMLWKVPSNLPRVPLLFAILSTLVTYTCGIVRFRVLVMPVLFTAASK